MGGTKTLAPREAKGVQSTFDEVVEKLQKVALRNGGKNFVISIDSLRSKPLKSTIKILGWKIEKLKGNSRISGGAKKFDKETTSKYQIITPSGFSNITTKTPFELNQISDYKKYHLEAFGLSNPKKPLSQQTKQEISELFSKTSIDSFDVAIDFNYPLDTSVLRAFGATDWCFGTCYINNPPKLCYTTKLCYYNKQAKDGLDYPLCRLEMTCKTAGKLSEMFIPDDDIAMVVENILQGVKKWQPEKRNQQ